MEKQQQPFSSAGILLHMCVYEETVMLVCRAFGGIHSVCDSVRRGR